MECGNDRNMIRATYRGTSEQKVCWTEIFSYGLARAFTRGGRRRSHPTTTTLTPGKTGVSPSYHYLFSSDGAYIDSTWVKREGGLDWAGRGRVGPGMHHYLERPRTRRRSRSLFNSLPFFPQHNSQIFLNTTLISSSTTLSSLSSAYHSLVPVLESFITDTWKLVH